MHFPSEDTQNGLHQLVMRVSSFYGTLRLIKEVLGGTSMTGKHLSESANIQHRVEEILRESLNLGGTYHLTANTRLKADLNADSMDVTTILIAMDETFDCEFNLDDLPRDDVTIEWIAKYVQTRLRRSAPALN